MRIKYSLMVTQFLAVQMIVFEIFIEGLETLELVWLEFRESITHFIILTCSNCSIMSASKRLLPIGSSLNNCYML